jgi:hypothetical protein
MQQSSQFVLQYQGQDYPLDKPQVIIGSDQRCDIRIDNDSQVLPMHVQVISQAGRVFIQHMQRGAAIWVNGSPASQQELRDQDELAVGDPNTRLRLLLSRNPARVNHQPESWTNAPQTTQSTGEMQLAEMQGTTVNNVNVSSAPRPALSSKSQAPMPAQAMGSKVSDATRYLCAAGHLDEDFQNYVMRNVIYEDHRAIGESYGVNMSTVVSWCKSGINRVNIRDSILAGVLVLVIFIYIFAPHVILGGITSIPYVGGLISILLIPVFIILLIIAYNIEKEIKRRWPKSHPGIITYLVLFIPLQGFGFIIIPIIWLTTLIELYVRYYGESVKHLRKNAFNLQAGPVPLDDTLARKLQENFSSERRNVIAYSGFAPFAGAGIEKKGWSWSFVINTNNGAYDTSDFTSAPKHKAPLPFTISSLYDAVERDVKALGMEDVLEIEGRLYVRGQYLPEHTPFFNATAQHPVTNVDPSIVAQYKEYPTEDIRYYQCLRFNFWRGEMIFTAYLRFIQRGKDLFVEVDYVLLPPMKPAYYWVDENKTLPSLRNLWSLYVKSYDGPIQMWLGAPLRLLRGRSYARQQRKLASIISNLPAFDYGAFTSLREYASDWLNLYHLFFQKLDEQMYLKVVEKQILQTISEFLEAHNIDTSELSQREQTILNSNVTNNTNNANFLGPVNNTGGTLNINAGGQAGKGPSAGGQAGSISR